MVGDDRAAGPPAGCYTGEVNRTGRGAQRRSSRMDPQPRLLVIYHLCIIKILNHPGGVGKPKNRTP